MFCTKCGKELNSGDRFCAHCGAETKQNEPQLHRYEDVVFNPPFRIEAERKTAEIMKEREEFRGFSEPEREEPKEAKPRERISINWNLDGLPNTEQKRTEEVNFDWGEVVERKNSSMQEPIGKFEFEPIIASRQTGLSEEYNERHAATNKEEKAERILDSLFGAGAGREMLKEEIPEPVVEQININKDASEDESIISLEDLEKELFGEMENLPAGGTATVQYRPLNISEVDSNEELDSFFGEDKPAAPIVDGEKFDPSVTAVFTPVENKLQDIFKERLSEIENEDEYKPLFEDIVKEASDIGEVDEPTTEAKPIFMTGELLEDEPETAEQPENIDLLDERLENGDISEASLEQKTLLEDSTDSESLLDEKLRTENPTAEELWDDSPFNDSMLGKNLMEEKPAADNLWEEVEEEKESLNLYDELFSEPELSPEQRANYKFYTFNRNTDAFKELLRREKERLEEMGADYVPQNVFAETSSKKQTPKSKIAYVSTALPAETTNVDATGTEQVIISGPGSRPAMPLGGENKAAANTEEKDNSGFKYADIFPGTEPANTFTSAGISISEEKLSQKTEKAQQLKEFFDEIDNEEPKHGGVFGKILLTILIIALLLCGTAFGAKYFFPDSIVATYSDIAIEKGLSLIDKIRGNDEIIEPIDDEVDTPYDSKAVYLSEIITANSAGLKTIGEILYSADENLRFDKLTVGSFEEVPSMPELEVTDGVANYDANPIISSVIAYYDSWLENNAESELIGINRLEIGDIRTDGSTAYVLSRIFFATEAAGEAVKVETVKIAIGETELTVEEVMEESLQ